MTCPRCHGTCMVPVHHNGVWSLDACPACVRRAEAEWLAWRYGLPFDDVAVKVAAE